MIHITRSALLYSQVGLLRNSTAFHLSRYRPGLLVQGSESSKSRGVRTRNLQYRYRYRAPDMLKRLVNIQAETDVAKKTVNKPYNNTKSDKLIHFMRSFAPKVIKKVLLNVLMGDLIQQVFYSDESFDISHVFAISWYLSGFVLTKGKNSLRIIGSIILLVSRYCMHRYRRISASADNTGDTEKAEESQVSRSDNSKQVGDEPGSGAEEIEVFQSDNNQVGDEPGSGAEEIEGCSHSIPDLSNEMPSKEEISMVITVMMKILAGGLASSTYGASSIVFTHLKLQNETLVADIQDFLNEEGQQEIVAQIKSDLDDIRKYISKS